MPMEVIHTPVLLQECLQFLCPDGAAGGKRLFLVDGTLGEGGHTEAFLRRCPGLAAAGVDADPVMLARAEERLAEFAGRVTFFHAWSDEFFRCYPAELPRPDIILCDLGISLFHYEKSGRGFSFRAGEPLDMRLDPSLPESAADIVNGRREDELADLLFRFGEERASRRIAAAIVRQRKGAPFRTAQDLAECVWHAVPPAARHGRIHPATRTFQALRIVVNRELDRLPRILDSAFSVLADHGRLGVITFHSLEDRIVKNHFRNLAKSCTCPPEMPICECGGKAAACLLTKKGVKASEEETAANPPSRSARLRVIRKIPAGEGENV